jgi:hypothetical protein
MDPKIRITPFRGEYYELVPERRHLVRNLIYPVPDPSFPFLGVHFTRLIHGGIEAGPNAVLALKREGYTSFSFHDEKSSSIVDSGLLINAETGLENGYSWSKSAFVKALRKLMPELEKMTSVLRSRGEAQALSRAVSWMTSRIIEAEGMIHVLNAPSPATASISIGKSLRCTRISVWLMDLRLRRNGNDAQAQCNKKNKGGYPSSRPADKLQIRTGIPSWTMLNPYSHHGFMDLSISASGDTETTTPPVRIWAYVSESTKPWGEKASGVTGDSMDGPGPSRLDISNRPFCHITSC